MNGDEKLRCNEFRAKCEDCSEIRKDKFLYAWPIVNGDLKEHHLLSCDRCGSITIHAVVETGADSRNVDSYPWAKQNE